LAVVDEAQDDECNLNKIDVLQEGMSHSSNRNLYVVGTGSSIGLSWPDFGDSMQSQFRWDIDSKTWGDQVVDQAPDRAAEGGGNSTQLVSQEDLPVTAHYKISQTFAPWITPERLEAKRVATDWITYANEVLGEHVESAAAPMTREKVIANIDIVRHQTPRTGLASRCFRKDVYCGIDLGGSGNTVMCFLSVIDKRIPVFEVLGFYVMRDSDPAKQWRQIKEMLDDVPDVPIWYDRGGNELLHHRILEEYGSRANPCVFSHTVSKSVVDKTMRHSKKHVLVNKTAAINGVFELLQPELLPDSRRVRFFMPGADPALSQKIIDHFTSLRSYIRNDREIYELMEGRRWDYLAAAVYAYAGFCAGKTGGGVCYIAERMGTGNGETTRPSRRWMMHSSGIHSSGGRM